jgi:ACT domain-containing protein
MNTSKYYDLRYNFHKCYISPVELKRIFLNKTSQLEYLAVDTVDISREAQIKYNNIYYNFSTLVKTASN